MRKHSIWIIAVVVVSAALLTVPNRAPTLTFNYIFESGFEQDRQNDMKRADDIWETSFEDNVTVNVKVGWGNPEDMEGIVAYTALNLKWMDYSFMRDRIIEDEKGELRRNGLVRLLPTLDGFKADINIPKDQLVIWVTQAEWKALGLTKDHFFPANGNCDPYDNCWDEQVDATILFNRDYFKSWHGENSRDFWDIAVHELGHVMGFDSALDRAGPMVGPTALDLYRFEKDSLHNDNDNDFPITLDEFRTNERNLSRDGVVPELFVNYDITNKKFYHITMSNARHNRQASHWFNLVDPNEIGIMDPGDETYFGYRPPNVTIPDVYAMDLIGWDVYDDVYDIFMPDDTLPWERDTDYSITAATALGDWIDESGMMTYEHLALAINQLGICQNIDCSNLSLGEKAAISYLESPKLVMDAFLQDVFVELQNPNPMFVELPWEEDVAGSSMLIHVDVPIPDNNLPVANAGPDQTVERTSIVGSEVTLDGSGSFDPNGDSLTYEWTWDSEMANSVNPVVTFPPGKTTVTLIVNDGEFDDSDTVLINVVDTKPPEVEIIMPDMDGEFQDGVTFTAKAKDISDVDSVYFNLREPDAGHGVPIGYENLEATWNSITGKWEYSFDTTVLDDGYYVILAKAVDSYGNEGWSEVVPFSIRNWAVIELLPSSGEHRAGRTMPVKFSLRIVEAVDPQMPFIYKEDLEIRIYQSSDPDNISQTSLFGDTSVDYRIDKFARHYITNFKTAKIPTEYTVEIWRTSKNFLIGSFTFETKKKIKS